MLKDYAMKWKQSNTVQGLVAMDDSLKGEGGDAIRSFYEECHLPFTLFFDSTNREFIDKLRWMTNALEALEPIQGIY